MAMAVGIAEYRAVERPEKPYVVGKRREHGPDLYIYYGSTDGFRSEDEIVRLLGDSVERGPSSRTGTWYVAHPLNKIRAPSQRRSDKTRTATFCGCGMELSLTGFCASCD
ncbi:hypothetical protein MINS_17810 [Mycolicibacterium insubricum]|jgi:hypothetical protein|nr:hypothetical protein MINS_17810 [Mycolicibacterium insubricum]